MTLKVSEPERGPGLWKMNYTVIQTDLFKLIFESFWNKIKFTADENEIYTRV
jgi:hypothetical protein